MQQIQALAFGRGLAFAAVSGDGFVIFWGEEQKEEYKGEQEEDEEQEEEDDDQEVAAVVWGCLAVSRLSPQQ